jgi:hypothetical protein
VLATFEYERGEVWNLRLEGAAEAVGVTPNHPFRSADRQDWVPAGELRIGERLQASDGTTPRVVSWTLRAEPEPVYNIEVDGDHVYRVGQQGLLVHNQSVRPPCEAQNVQPGFQNRIVEEVRRRRIDYPSPPASRFYLSIIDNVIARLNMVAAPGAGPPVPDRPIRWAISGPGHSPTAMNNPNRIGAFVGRNPTDANDSVGHIIGRQFFGEAQSIDDGRRNVFAQNEVINNGAFSTFENSIAATIPHVCSICVRISFRYERTQFPDRPSRFTYSWWVESPAGVWHTGYTIPPGNNSPQTFNNPLEDANAQIPRVPWRE